MTHFSSSELLDRICAGPGDPRPVPSVLVVAAHPDDEVIGCGICLRRLGTATVVHVTDGAPRSLEDARAAGFKRWEDYAAVRRQELEQGLALAGIAPEQILSLGYADQGTSHALTDLTADVAGLLREIEPDAVITHPYEGGHPDHDATAFAVHAACRTLQREGRTPPAILEMASYHLENGKLITGAFLAGTGRDERAVVLSEEERMLKQCMFDCHLTQAAILEWFTIGEERFRTAPRYDFTKPPHEGTLHYEQFDWGITGEGWRRLASKALQEWSQAPERTSGIHHAAAPSSTGASWR